MKVIWRYAIMMIWYDIMWYDGDIIDTMMIWYLYHDDMMVISCWYHDGDMILWLPDNDDTMMMMISWWSSSW